MPADVALTFLRTNGTTLTRTFTVAKTSRFTVSITGTGSHVPELVDEAFGTIVESTQPIVVERSMYSNAGGVMWAAGTNATATRGRRARGACGATPTGPSVTIERHAIAVPPLSE